VDRTDALGRGQGSIPPHPDLYGGL
jgi:hypothetical protein